MNTEKYKPAAWFFEQPSNPEHEKLLKPLVEFCNSDRPLSEKLSAMHAVSRFVDAQLNSAAAHIEKLQTIKDLLAECELGISEEQLARFKDAGITFDLRGVGQPRIENLIK